ncbi:OmpA family protein [Vibrio parahaemolyticus]|uniref:OmpA family protein n=1 Tax=Vibrio parahaemolyticus TaxID=670 RepID=UPI0022EAC1F9|nr:OmpA family protein [Vibrio parahaemolyticus]
MKLTSISLFLSFFFGGTVMANPVLDISNYWVGAGVGAAQLELSDGHNDSTTRSFSGKFEMGLDLNQHLGIYSGYDFVQYIPEAQDIHLGTFGVRGKFGIGDKLDLVAKVAVTYPFGEKNSSGFSSTLGAGVEYRITNALSTKVGLDYYHDLSLREQHSADIVQAYWGMSYRFGQPDTPMVVTKEVIKEVPVEVIKTVESANIVIIGDLLFKTGSSDIGALPVLDRVVEVLLEDTAANVRIVGHTDSVGSESFNQTLSEQRANAVARYLNSKGIEFKRMDIEGQGELEPVSSNDNKEGRMNNRRVELFIK